MNRRNFLIGSIVSLGGSAIATPIKSLLGMGRTTYIPNDNFNPTAKDYVQDGLEIMWDGIENVGWGEHDSSSTTWIDLMGFIKPCPINISIWGDDCLNIETKSIYDLVMLGNVTDSQKLHDWLTCCDPYTGWTIEFATKLDTTKQSNRVESFSGTSNNNIFAVKQYFAIDSHPTYALYQSNIRANGLSGDTGASTYVPILDGQFIRVTLRYNAGVYTRIINSRVLTNAVSVSALYGESYYRKFGPFSTGWFNGPLYFMRHYSRALTDEEISYNTKIDKARFGI